MTGDGVDAICCWYDGIKVFIIWRNDRDCDLERERGLSCSELDCDPEVDAVLAFYLKIYGYLLKK